MDEKFTEKLCVMTIKNDATFEEGLTCFKIDIRNLTNFDLSTQKVSGVMFDSSERLMQNLKEN